MSESVPGDPVQHRREGGRGRHRENRSDQRLGTVLSMQKAFLVQAPVTPVGMVLAISTRVPNRLDG